MLLRVALLLGSAVLPRHRWPCYYLDDLFVDVGIVGLIGVWMQIEGGAVEQLMVFELARG